MSAPTKVVISKLPHGRIPFEDITDPRLKRVVMLFNDNIAALKLQLETAQKAVQELQRR